MNPKAIRAAASPKKALRAKGALRRRCVTPSQQRTFSTAAILTSPTLTRERVRVPEWCYGDGDMKGTLRWVVGKNENPAETATDAVGSSRLAITRLRKQAEVATDDDRREAFEQIAEAIEGCAQGHRCHHDDCPLCLRARQRWFAWTAPVALRKACPDEPLAVLSIIPDVRLTAGATLAHIKEQITRIVAMLKSGIEEAGIGLLVGGIDISANERRVLRRRRGTEVGDQAAVVRYQLHLWAIGSMRDIRKAENALRATFGKSTTVHRPVMIGSFDGDLAGFAYALKTSFHRRIALARTPKVVAAADGNASWTTINRRRNTRKKPLTVAQHAHVMLMLHLLGFDRRLFLIGAHVTENKNGSPVIRQHSA